MTKELKQQFTLKISQANKTELIVIMYEMAIKYIDDGLESLSNNNIEEYRLNLKRSKAVINELTSVLDMSYVISYELRSLYIFINNVLVRADIRVETDELKRVREMLIKLSKSFKKVSADDNSGPVMENTQQLYAGLTYSKTSLNVDMYSDVNRGFKA